jgi:hypothetical protein
MASRLQRRRDWIVEEGKALPSFPSLRPDINGYAYMFVQDFSAGIVPYGARAGENKPHVATLSGNTKQTDRAIDLLLSLGGRHYSDLDEIVLHAIQEIAQNVSWFGRMSYEVVHPSRAESISLMRSFTPQRLFNLHWRFLQVVPKKDRHLWKKSFNWLLPSDVWIISVPRALGGYRGYRAILRKLRRYDGLGPHFYRVDLERGTMATNFDFLGYHREIEVFQSRITRKWGWNRRDFSSKNWTEFMQFYRTLTFRWAQAIFREHIVSEFNLLLGRLGINATLSVSGIPSSAEILHLREEMAAGNISYVKAYESTLI